MVYIERYIERFIKEDLKKKMVFISGPRQCGKTTLAKKILENDSNNLEFAAYMSWDYRDDREKIMNETFPAGRGLLVLDEIHKYARWRQVVKGLYDKRNHELKIIVTGSGRLDYYKHGGDSLPGRYHFYRLHPFTLPEIEQTTEGNLITLFNSGGFPEQFISRSERESRRWSKEYGSRIVNEELNTLENIKNISLVEHLTLRLPDLVGSPLSINALREDLQVSHQTVSRWLTMLENIYMIFRLYPFGAPKIRAVKKEAKHYHFDWNLIEDQSIRFENMVAVHLLNYCHFKQDYEGLNYELRYFRDIDRREVDFVILLNGKPVRFIECKLKSRDVNAGLRYLKKRFPECEAIQISLYSDDDYLNRDGIRVCPAYKFLKDLL